MQYKLNENFLTDALNSNSNDTLWVRVLSEAPIMETNPERRESIENPESYAIAKYVIRAIQKLNTIRCLNDMEYEIAIEVLKYMDISKGGTITIRQKWSKLVDFSNHGEASAKIYHDYFRKDKSNTTSDVIENLIFMHGIPGQIIRGEASLRAYMNYVRKHFEINIEFVDYMKDRKSVV